MTKPSKASAETTIPFHKVLWKLTAKMIKGKLEITVTTISGHADKALDTWTEFKDQLVKMIKAAFKQLLSLAKTAAIINPAGVEEVLSLS